MLRQVSEIELADDLIMRWYEWTLLYRPNTGYPSSSVEFRNSRTSRQWDSTAEITADTVDKDDLEAVEWCYDELSSNYQNAIQCEMKNRQVKAKVWRPMMGKTYQEALAAIIPHMQKKNLLFK